MCDLDHPKARRLFLDPTAGLRLAGGAGESFGAWAIESESRSAPTRPEVCPDSPAALTGRALMAARGEPSLPRDRLDAPLAPPCHSVFDWKAQRLARH